MPVMKALTSSMIFPVLFGLLACVEPQIPASDGAGALSGAPASGDAAPVVSPGAGSAPQGPGPVSQGTAAPRPGDRLGDAYTVTLLQTGGVAGLRMETVVDAANRHITYGGPRNQRPERREITADDVKALTHIIEDAGYKSFPGRIRPPKGSVLSDAFSYTITVRTGGKEYTAAWEDETPIPDSYSVLHAAIEALRVSKFDGQTPKGAPTM